MTASTYPNVTMSEVELAANSSYMCRVRAGNAKGTSGWRKLEVNT